MHARFPSPSYVLPDNPCMFPRSSCHPCLNLRWSSFHFVSSGSAVQQQGLRTWLHSKSACTVSIHFLTRIFGLRNILGSLLSSPAVNLIFHDLVMSSPSQSMSINSYRQYRYRQKLIFRWYSTPHPYSSQPCLLTAPQSFYQKEIFGMPNTWSEQILESPRGIQGINL